MERGYEIIVSQEDLKEKDKLGIEYPFYMDKYLDIIKIFLENNKRIRQNMREDIGNNKEMYNAYEKFPNDMSNIITIVGGRGTGKTTVLQEIRTIFMDFGNERLGVKEKWVKKLGMPHREELGEQADQTFKISAMEVIDASALEEQDDLLEIILWHICEDVRKKLDFDGKESRYRVEEWERQNFLETLDEVYRMHQRVKGKSEGITGGESVITALENMPNSIKTRNAMHKLLDLYCKIMFPEKEQSTYLIIAIDDLDLNIKKSYQILEEIRRYLLDWRIVILLAVDNKQMEEVCITHFYNEFGVARNNFIKNDLAKHIRDLSNSYLLKVMAAQNRIYLSEEKLQMAQIWEKDSDQHDLWDIKKYLLFNIARKMHIFYDANGLKKHFCEPNTIRDLIFYMGFLKSLNLVKWDVPEGESEEKYLEQQLQYYNQNYTRFYQDIVERMTFQILQFEQHEIFLEIKKCSLERRTGYALRWYEESLDKKGKSKAIEEMEHFDFGDFLGCIYNWGRKNYEYKALVHCILASFTAEMTKEYYNYRYNLVDTKSAEHSKRKLERYVGDNISGGWLSEGIGNVFWLERVIDWRDIFEDKHDFVKKENKKLISIEKEKELQYIEFRYNSINCNEGRNEERYVKILDKFTSLDILPILECLFLCLDNYRKTKGGIECRPQIVIEREQKINPKEKKVTNSKIDFVIKVQIAQCADFDILGFVKKSIDYQDWRDRIGSQLIEGFMEQASEISGYKPNDDKSDKCKKAIEKFEKTSLFAGKEYDEMALPLYNLDLSYNILKRVRHRCQGEFSFPIEISNVLERISRIYNLIEEELENEEKQYEKINVFTYGEEAFMYKRNFQNDPYIKKFRELQEKKETETIFLEYMKMLYLGTSKLDSLGQISPNLNIE